MVKAIVYSETGPASVWKYVQDWSVPDRKLGEVKIAVKSTSYNPADSKIRAGSFGPVALPKVSGGDVAGVVVETDPGSEYKSGDPVIAMSAAFMPSNPNGSWAEYTVLPENTLVRLPKNLSLDTEAGALPVVSLTAFQGLEKAKIQKGDRVLVHAGSGGVGHIAVQLAKHHWGAYVVSTSRYVDLVKSLGADEVIDYTQEDFALKLRDQPRFSAILDTVAEETELKSYELLTEDGTYSQIRSSRTDPARVEAGKQWPTRKYVLTIFKQNREQLQIVADLVGAGKLKPIIGAIVPIAEAEKIEEVAAKKHAGKVLIQI